MIEHLAKLLTKIPGVKVLSIKEEENSKRVESVEARVDGYYIRAEQLRGHAPTGEVKHVEH